MKRTKLVEARARRNWTLEEAAEHIGCASNTLDRWELGTMNPTAYNRARLCETYSKTMEELELDDAILAEMRFTGVMRNFQAILDADPRLRPLVLAFTLRCENVLHIQRALAAAIEELQMDTSHEAALTRRDALHYLATFPLLVGLGGAMPLRAEDVLRLSAGSLTACWHLMNGSDFSIVEAVVQMCLPHLEDLAVRPSRHQKEAAHLASQGHLLSSLLAFHRSDVPTKLVQGQESVKYARMTDDPSLVVSALVSLASTYYYNNTSRNMLQTYQDAYRYMKHVPPILQSRIQVGLATAYAQQGESQKAERAIELAQETFSQQEKDVKPMPYLGFGSSSLILWEGLTYLELDRLEKADETFERMTTLNRMPERVRLEIINHRTEAAIGMGDLDRFEAHIKQGVAGANALGSKRRWEEAFNVYRQGRSVWRNEARVRDLGDLFR